MPSEFLFRKYVFILLMLIMILFWEDLSFLFHFYTENKLYQIQPLNMCSLSTVKLYKAAGCFNNISPTKASESCLHYCDGS